MGNIWSNNTGVPSQEKYNIEGNGSIGMVKRSYLINQFYGFNNLFEHYHFPGEGNFRGFVGRGLNGADALLALNLLVGIRKDFLLLGEEPKNLELKLFSDIGSFWNKYYHPWVFESYKNKTLADAGIGFSFDTEFFERNLFIRFDFPFFIYNGSNSNFSSDSWLFSFQRSM